MKWISICLATLTGCATQHASLRTGENVPGECSWTNPRRGKTEYLYYLPKEYQADSTKKWPLMLFLHGAGERGSDLSRITVHGPLKLTQQGKEFPFIIIAPLCPKGEAWQNEALLRMLDHAKERFRVDPDRVYLTGLSMGGYGAWKLGIGYPELFAALIPICGGADPIDSIIRESPAKDAALRALPIWAFHGAKDPIVPLSESERSMAYLKHWNCTNTRLTVYPEADHNSWSQTYENPEVFDWMLRQKRGQSKP
jgi:predicted peptidase